MNTVLPLHMGALHPVEQLLTLTLAFGPFVVLGGVIWWRRRRDEESDAPEVRRRGSDRRTAP